MEHPFEIGRGKNGGGTLKALTSLNKKVRQLFLGDKGIWSFPSVSTLIANTAVEGPQGYFRVAIIAFGALQLVVPKYNYRLGRMDKRSLDS